MQFALLKSLSPENARMRFRQGKLNQFDYALYLYLCDEKAVNRFMGSDIVRLRQDLSLTQEALGDILAVTKRTVLRWENEQDPVPGTVNIALNALMKLNVGFFDLMAPEKTTDVSSEIKPVLSGSTLDAKADEDPFPLNFDAKAVTELRERLRMTRREFAAFLDVSTSTVDKWETGAVLLKGPALTLLKILWRDGPCVMP